MYLFQPVSIFYCLIKAMLCIMIVTCVCAQVLCNFHEMVQCYRQMLHIALCYAVISCTRNFTMNSTCYVTLFTMVLHYMSVPTFKFGSDYLMTQTLTVLRRGSDLIFLECLCVPKISGYCPYSVFSSILIVNSLLRGPKCPYPACHV